MTTGEKIKALRQQAGLSQSQLAEELHVSRAAIAKWENENGMPDVTNLKALAEYFHSDVDVLLDETKGLKTEQQEEERFSTDTYCGKFCETCPDRERLGCPGCKLGPGTSIYGICEIAKCCITSRKRNCRQCSIRQHCSRATKTNAVPQKMEMKQKQQEHIRKTLERQVPFFRKWVKVLFCVGVFAWVMSVLAGVLFFTEATHLPLAAAGCFVGQFVYSLILLYMSKENRRFKTAGVLFLLRAIGTVIIASQLYRAPNNMVADMMVILLIMLASFVLYTVGNYHENAGFAENLFHLNVKLSTLWRKLWWAHMSCIFILTFLANTYVAIDAVEGEELFILLLFGTDPIVVTLLKYVCLYRTVKCYKRCN